jgi:predicted RNase H-like nuclease (RuvC/YqgF family)
MLDTKCKELKQENKHLQDNIQLLKAELSHAKQFEQAIDFLKDSSLQQASRITELETQLGKAHTKEHDLEL